MNGFFIAIKDFLTMSSYKKNTTLSGALVFFTLIGVVPITYIASLIFSVLGSEISVIKDFFSYPEFYEIITYVTETAVKLGAEGNIIAFFVALYSSANIFYHLRQSGEVIYNYEKNSSLFTRITSIVIAFLTVCVLSLFIVVYVAIVPLITRVLGESLSVVINVSVGVVSVFFIVCLINVYVCPFKLKFYEVYKGAIYSTLFSFIATGLFFAYIRFFSNYDEIYGKIATVLVFLSWLYLIINGVLQGITLNVYLIGKTNIKKTRKNDKIKTVRSYKKV